MASQVADYEITSVVADDGPLPCLRARRPARLGEGPDQVTIWVLGPLARTAACSCVVHVPGGVAHELLERPAMGYREAGIHAGYGLPTPGDGGGYGRVVAVQPDGGPEHDPDADRCQCEQRQPCQQPAPVPLGGRVDAGVVAGRPSRARTRLRRRHGLAAFSRSPHGTDPTAPEERSEVPGPRSVGRSLSL